MNRLFVFICISALFSMTQAQLPIPEYHKGKALLSGIIENYKPENDLKFMIGAPNLVMGSAETLFPTVKDDGSFSIDIPIYHATQIRMIIDKEDIYILLKPEEKTTVTINLNHPKGKQFVFGGTYATFNNEWSQPELIKRLVIAYKNDNKLDSIVDMDAYTYKASCLNEYRKAVAHNEAQKQFSEDTRTLANLSCAFDCLHNLQAAHYCLQTAYQKKNNKTWEQAYAAFLDTHLPDDFYDCLKEFPVNHPLALYCYAYRDVLLSFYNTRNEYLSLEKHLLTHAPLTQAEQALIHQNEIAFKTGTPFQQQSDVTAITLKYEKESNEYYHQRFAGNKKYLTNLVGDSVCLFIDYARAIYMRSSLFNLKPLNAQQEQVASEITNPILKGIIKDMNQQNQPRKRVTAKKFTVCETPPVLGEKLLQTLIDRYRGKVLFIDFWATWCGGCRQIIKEYEPLKAEIAEGEVAFIYLTGPSSIEKTWNTLIPEIAGEHYWLNKEQWNYLWQHFKMTGLPMYLLIDKQGNIVKRFTHITVKILKELLKIK